MEYPWGCPILGILIGNHPKLAQRLHIGCIGAVRWRSLAKYYKVESLRLG